MNCPNCRKKPWYLADLSDNNKGLLTYLCPNCMVLLHKEPFRGKLPSPWRGYRYLTLKLHKWGYTPPPLPKRGGVKEAGFREIKESASSPKRGE